MRRKAVFMLPAGGAMLALVGMSMPVTWRLPPQVRPECPQNGAWTKVLPALGNADGSRLRLPGAITDIVEFHDCQQFIVPDSTTGALRYTSLFAVFARFRLDTAYQAPRGIAFDPATMGTPMAIILAFDNTYEPLGIKSGFNCLYFYYRKNGNGGLATVSARMVPVRRQSQRCVLPLPAGSTVGTELAVDARAYRSEIPPVARWDWDDSNKMQYIGIRCQEAWCEVKPTIRAAGAVFKSSVSRFAPASMAKGWFDEQTLAVPGLASGEPPRVSRIRATFMPAPDLGDQKMSDPAQSRFSAQWVSVASVGLDADDGGYSSKLNFERTPRDSALNQVALCFLRVDSAFGRRCFPTAALRPDCPVETKNSGRWYARVISSSGRTRYFCVTRRAHDHMPNMPPVPPIPGIVRWRWAIDDETMWIRCLQGCCEARAL